MRTRPELHAHRPEDLAELPRVRRPDIQATLMGIAVIAIIFFLCSLDGIS